ncbi:MAG TPA: preprotein translocase subunit SecG [Candidatus Binataceae bacterium]
MYSIILSVHVVVCIAMTIVVLLQQGKGADIGAVFGGSSQTVFGSSGAGNFLTRLTAGLAVVFFLTSISLAYFSNARIGGSIFDKGVPVTSLPASKAPAAPPLPGSSPPAPPAQ